MAYASTHTDETRLSLVPVPAAPIGREGIRLEPSQRLSDFLATAASSGVEAPDAVRMALERALALEDATRLTGDTESARRRLSRAASQARPRLEMGTRQAAWIRNLKVARQLDPPDASGGLVVAVPDRQMSRARAVAQSSIRAAIVTEMIAWEVAAALEGRTMGEWALWTLTGTRRVS
jgi:hypothetical protein